MSIRTSLLIIVCATFSISLHAMWGGDCYDYSRGNDGGSLHGIFFHNDLHDEACEDSDSESELTQPKLRPFTIAEVRAMKAWKEPESSEKKEAWTLEELLQDPQTQRLRISPQDIKDILLERVPNLGTSNLRYTAACCIAAGANPEKHATRTSWLSEAIGNNDVGFVQSIAHAKPNPNRKHLVTHGKEEIALEEPLFFNAGTVQMAQALLGLGADYKENGGLSNGTILHHLCTVNFGGPLVKLLQFYLAHGADVHAVDGKGRTPIQVVGENLPYANVAYSIPYALMLLRYGARPYTINQDGRTFLECIDEYKYQPKPGHLNNRLFYAYMEQYLKPRATKKSTMPTCCTEQPMQCACLQDSHQEVVEFTQESFAQLKVALPLVPEPCALLDCNELRKHPAYKWWRLLKNATTPDTHIDQETKQILEKEIETCFMDWQKGRMLAALTIPIDPQAFVAVMKERKFEIGDIALLEDDIAFVEYMLRHNVHLIDYTGWARSVVMAALLKKFYPERFAGKNNSGGNTLHHVALYGALMDDDLPSFYLEHGIDPLLANTDGHTPLGLLVYYSYRYMRQEKKLIEIARILLLAGSDPLSKNEKTRKSPLECAQEAHALWNVPATGMLLTLLSAVSQERALLKKVHVIETVSRQLLADLNPRKLARTAGQKLQKIVTEKK